MADAEYDQTGDTLSLIERARSGARDDLELVFRRFEPVLQRFLFSKGISESDAAELVQGFFVQKILDGKLLKQFDSSRGRFRAYLCSSLNNYRFDQYRRKKTQLEPLDWHDPVQPPLDTDLFDVVFVQSIVSQTLESVRDECGRRNQLLHWAAFDERYLRPMLETIEPTPFANLAVKYGFVSETQVSNCVETIRRKFKRIFESHLKELAPEEEQATEFGHIRDSLALARHDPSPALDNYMSGKMMNAGESLGGVSVRRLHKFVERLENRELRSWESFDAELEDVMKTPFDVFPRPDHFPEPQSEVSSMTVRELLISTSTSVEQLTQVKGVFKWLGRSPLSIISPQMAQFTYVCSILAALALHRSRITSLSDDDLRNGHEWVQSMTLPDEWDKFLERANSAVHDLSHDSSNA